MNANIKLGKIIGIPIGIHSSWFLIFGLMTLSLATAYFPAQNPDFPITSNLILGLLASLLLFGSVLAHELGHAFIAVRNKIPVRRITLFIFGGVAQIEKEPSSPGEEFRIAIAGPIVSLGLAGIFWGISLFDQFLPFLATATLWLARTNLILAIFNLVPGFPLDGGRVLRALVWRLTGNLSRATRIASLSGQLVAFGFMGYGLVSALMTGNLLGGLWLVFIGWYLRSAAIANQEQSAIQQILQGVTVDQVMSKDVYYVPSLISLKQLVDDYIIQQGKKHFVVSDVQNSLGFITVDDIRGITQNQWPYLTTGQVMIPIERLKSLSPDTELGEALKWIQTYGSGTIPVVDQNDVVGTLSIQDVMRFIQLRKQFSS